MPFVGQFTTPVLRDWQCPTCRLATRPRNGLFAIPNNPFIVAAVQALCAGGPSARLTDGGWRRDKDGAPLFEFWNGSGGRIRVRVAGEEAAAAWAEVESFSALTLDAAITLLAALAADHHRAATCAPRRESVWLGAPAVLNAKSYRRYGAERAQFAAAVDVEIERLTKLRFDIVNYPAFDPGARSWRSEGVSRADVRLFETAEHPIPQDANDCRRAQPLRFGVWAEHWLNAAGPMWASPLPQAVIGLDHRENRGADILAKKVAVLVALNAGASRGADQIRLEVRTLLRRVGELRRPGTDAPHYAGRLADRLEEALLRLTEAGVMYCRLNWDAASALRAEGKRWFDDWLNAEIVIERPSFISARSLNSVLKPQPKRRRA